MNKKIFFAILVFIMLGSIIKAQEKPSRDWFHLSNQIEIYNTNISGPGAGQSSLTIGTHFIDLLNLNGIGSGYSYNLGFKATDDRTKDIKDYTLTNLGFRLTKGPYALNCGDTYESFTQYTNNSLLKGFSLKYSNPVDNSTEVTFLYGIDIPRWDSFSKEQGLEVTRKDAWGLRGRHDFRNGFSFGITGIKSADNNFVLISTNTSDILYKNTVYSVDAEYTPLEGLTFKTEVARSVSLESVYMSTTSSADFSGNAFMFKTVGDTTLGKITLEYENISPEFLTLLGSATKDREKIKFFWKLNVGKKLNIFFNYLGYRNNLDGTGITIKNSRPEIGCSIMKLFRRQYSNIDIRFQFENQSSAGSETMNNTLNLNYRDRFFGSLDNETTILLANYTTSGNIRNSLESAVTTLFRKRYTKGSYTVRPLGEFSGWTREDKISSTKDTRVGFGVGFDFEIPIYKFNSTIKINQSNFSPQKGDSMITTGFNLQLNYRLSLKPFNYGLVFIRIVSNDYKSSNESNSFREDTASAGLNIEF